MWSAPAPITLDLKTTKNFLKKNDYWSPIYLFIYINNQKKNKKKNKTLARLLSQRKFKFPCDQKTYNLNLNLNF